VQLLQRTKERDQLLDVLKFRSQGKPQVVGLPSYKVSVTIVTCHSGEKPVKYLGEADLYQTPGDTCATRTAGVVEPVFANICVQKRMHHLTLRTKLKVDVQWRLFALVHNLGKIHTFGALHEPVAKRNIGETAFRTRIWSLHQRLAGKGTSHN
jgi:hypothetical protein